MPDAEELGARESVFRLVPLEDRFIPRDREYPNGEVFNPSTKDKEDAENRGVPIRVTVWDTGLTTPAEAKAIWSRLSYAVAYGLQIVNVIELRQKHERPELRIVRDPLPDDARPGSDGHCGFEGLDRRPGEQRVKHKTLLDDVAQKCREIARL